MTELSPEARNLLVYLVDKLTSVIPGKPETYVGYKQAHDELGLPQKGPTWGASLKNQGLSELAEWTASNDSPGITGIIIDSTKYLPGDGYFHLFNKNNDDFAWWKSEIEKSKQHDWSQYLRKSGDVDFEQWLVEIGKSPKTAKNYAGAITGSLSNWAIENGITDVPLFEIKESSQIISIADALRTVEIYLVRNQKGGNMYSCALKSYEEYLRDISNEHIEADISEIIKDEKIGETEKSTLINARVGQGKYRQQLIEIWNSCALTGYQDTRFLIASHIKPWRESKSPEKLDPYNGLLLLPNIDKVFDYGYITFDENGRIIVSSLLEDINTLGINKSMVLSLKEDNKPYLEYHREHIYKN
jgi:hypothetical protein